MNLEFRLNLTEHLDGANRLFVTDKPTQQGRLYLKLVAALAVERQTESHSKNRLQGFGLQTASIFIFHKIYHGV